MTGPDLLAPPAAAQRARFAPGFGQRVLLTVDTEEEFDWTGPFRRDGWGLDHLGAVPRFQAFCETLGVVPLYLVDWPVADSPLAREILGPAIAAGRAEVGVQLHPWVNPPFEEEVSVRNSFAGNLPPALEEAKFARLRDRIEDAFGTAPRSYRAGRYGLGRASAAMLMRHGIGLDTSVRANYDYSPGHGPDYARHPLEPYWVDPDHRLLEAPVTTAFWGVLRRQGRLLHPLGQRVPLLGGALSRLGLAERIALTPEGVSVDEALRGIDVALDDGLPLLVLSFHSPSLAPGHTPYVRDAAGVEALYGWLTAVYGYLARRGVRPTTVAEVLAAAQP